MTVMDGLQLADRIREMASAIMIILMIEDVEELPDNLVVLGIPRGADDVQALVRLEVVPPTRRGELFEPALRHLLKPTARGALGIPVTRWLPRLNRATDRNEATPNKTVEFRVV